MKKRVIAALLTASMAVGLLAGCGSSGGDSGGESKEAGKQGKEASSRFIDVNPSPERQKYYEGVFQKFEEETGISEPMKVFRGMMLQISLRFSEHRDSFRM